MNEGRIYRTLLRLYPGDYRAVFAVEMGNAFDRVAEDHRPLGRPAFLRFLVSEFSGLFISIGAEWVAKWTTDSSVRGRCLPDLRMMRPPGVPRELWFAGACLSGGHSPLPDEVMEARALISVLIQRTVHAIANHDFPGARRYSREERQARGELRRLQEKYNLDDSGNGECS
jgi:hypothetical protein